jgi:hypothetical protein
MNVLDISEDSPFFKFPFTDNENSDLKLSKNLYKSRGSESSGLSSDLDFGLSPIARSRDSATSIDSYVEYIEGETLILDSDDRPRNSTEKGGKPVSPRQSGNYVDSETSSSKETTKEQEHMEYIEGETLVPDSDDSARNSTGEEENPISPRKSENFVEVEMSSSEEATKGRENIELSEMSPKLNRSLSPGSLQTAMKQVGEHSSKFIDKIRDAAHKRKVEVTRSRDSLVAKEQEQLRSIAECKTMFAAIKQKLHRVEEENSQATKENNVDRLRKITRRNNGFGGVGVPKVEKRPTTTPKSPMLGLRRKGPNLVPKWSEGQRDVSKRKPKVEKRPTTTPKSPILGLRRKGPNLVPKVSEGQKNVSKSKPTIKKRPTTTPKSPTLGLQRKGPKLVPKASEGQKDTSKRKPTIRPKPRDSRRFNDATGGKTNDSDQPNRSKRNTTRKSIERDKTFSPLKARGEVDSINIASAFRALPVPISNARRWDAGQLGIPKVSKRALTVPVSPCLGPKRQPRVIVERNGETNNENLKPKMKKNTLGLSSGSSISSRSKAISPSSVRSSPLIGLTLIHSMRKAETTEPQSNDLKTPIFKFKPFVPRSTTRANMRKQYDSSRDEKRAFNLQEKRERLRSQIKAMHQELKILGKDLS